MAATAIEPHDFQYGYSKQDRAGRRLRYCLICDKPAVGKTHAKAKGETNAFPPLAAGADTWELRLLRIAVDRVLDMPADSVGWRMRLRVLDVQKAFSLTDDLPLMQSAEVTPPVTKTHRAPVHRGSAHFVRKAVSGDYANIGLRAVEDGWLVRRNGRDHLLFTDPIGAGSFMLPSTGGKGRGYANAKASAKRAGLNVEGL